MTLSSQVIISQNLEETLLKLKALISDETFTSIVKEDNFLLEDASLVIEKAYIASEKQHIIVLGAKHFSPLVQNKLLKVIEEPPKNKIFILLTQSKASILDTIRSRLPLSVEKQDKTEDSLGLDLSTLSLATVYMFVQQHKRSDVNMMKIIIEQISKEAIKSQAYSLDKQSLTLLSSAYRALDMGSPPSFILHTVLLKLLAKKKR